RGEDLLGEVLGRVGLWAGEAAPWMGGERGTAGPTELLPRRERSSTARAGRFEPRATVFAEARVCLAFSLAAGTLHPGLPIAVRLGRIERRSEIRSLPDLWSTSLTWGGHFWKYDHSGRSHRFRSDVTAGYGCVYAARARPSKGRRVSQRAEGNTSVCRIP